MQHSLDALPHMVWFQHDLALTALSFAVSLGASATALRLMIMASHYRRARSLLLMFGGACGGAGGWATSFITLMSFEPGYAIGFDGWRVLASLVTPVVGGALGIWAALHTPRPWNVPAWGVFFAVGVGLMDYISLGGLRVGGETLIQPGSIAASLICGPALAMAAMRLALRARRMRRFLAASTVMATALFSMQAVMEIGLARLPGAQDYVAASAGSRVELAVGIAGLTALLGVTALLCVWLPARAMGRSHARLKAVIEALPHALAYFDSADCFVLGNQRYLDELALVDVSAHPGEPHRDILGRIAAKIPANTTPELRQAWIEDRLGQGEAKGYGSEQTLSDGRHLRSTSNRTATGGLVLVLYDITDLKRQAEELAMARDQAEAATHAKSQFLATMSHEIRTPLNGVLGMAQALAADPLPAVQRERLDVIRQSGESLLCVLNDVLDISKIEAGKLELELTDFDLDELVRTTHSAHLALAEAKGVAFRWEMEPGTTGVYRGDPTRVRQILINLVSNALKFTAKGEVALQVRQEGAQLAFRVSDTGIGMTELQAVNLFQKFSQADASTTRRFGGTGLGLAICKDLATLMGGEITVETRVGEGSTFTVALPLERVSAQGAAQAPQDRVERPEPLSLRVLAAEDNPVNQLVLRTLLAQAGIEPVVVGDGVQAVEAWMSGDWDLILMDVQMPEMDGPTATREIRLREAMQGRPRTPIIALTANAMAHQLQAYREAGMDGFVAKPVEVGKLFDAIEDALSAPPPQDIQAEAA